MIRKVISEVSINIILLLLSIFSKSTSKIEKRIEEKLSNKNANDKVKVFVWNSVGGLQPIKDNKVFQIADGQKVTVKTRVTNYTPSESNIFFDIIPHVLK